LIRFLLYRSVEWHRFCVLTKCNMNVVAVITNLYVDYSSVVIVYRCDVPNVQLMRYCLIRHPNDIILQIDSTFCPSCLENVPSGEARIKRNRCASCMQCPVCSMTLVVRSNTQTESSGDTKLFYLQCNNCRWTTRDANIADQTTPTSAWPSITNPNEPMVIIIC